MNRRQFVRSLSYGLAASLLPGVLEAAESDDKRRLQFTFAQVKYRGGEWNPHPLAVVWAGPIFGVAIPGLLLGAAASLRLRGRFVLRFFAGFCGLANGLYLGLGSFAAVGDCGDLLRHGAGLWQLWLFGAVVAPAGLWLWHGQGGQFGLGPAAQPIDRPVAVATLAGSMLLVLLGWGMGR